MKLNTLVGLLATAFAAPLALASSNGLVISQVYGGGGATTGSPSFKHDYVELFNAGSQPVNLAGYSLQYASATGTGSWNVSALSNLSNTVLQPGRYLLIRQGTGGSLGADISTQDGTGTLNLSASAGKIALVANSTALSGANPAASSYIDLVGYGGANGFETAPTPVLSNTSSALRKSAGCKDDNNNSQDFDIGSPLLRNSATPANVCGGGVPVDQPIVPVCPDSSATAGQTSRFNVTASDADSIVNARAISGTWPAGITLGAFTPAQADGGVATAEIEVDASAGGGSYSLNLQWANNEAQTAVCSFKVNVAGLTPIYSIQGSGASSPLLNQTVSTGGVVTYLSPTGFYLQDPLGDGNPATSDGIFVFTSTAPTVAVGQKLQLSGVVTEFTAGQGTITQLKNISGLTVLSSGHQIEPTAVNLATLPNGALEAYEGMLVTLLGPITVQQNYFLGRYGQLTLAAGGRLLNPTNILRPGPDANALAQANLARAIILDDNTLAQNPNPVPFMGQDNTVRAGDTLESLTGVIDFGPATSNATGASMYRLQPVGTPQFQRSNPRPQTAPVVGGNVRIASANVLNFFTTFTNGQTASGQTGQGCSLGGASSAANCRGADNLNEFTRQKAKIVASLSTLNADVVGLMEMQNNGQVAVQNLVDGLNAVLGAGTYASVALPGDTGDDAIRVAMIYKPAKLSPVGAPLSDTDPVNNRPTLAQGFRAANGERFAVLVNHLKSKSCSGASGTDADQGDLQGCYNATRQQQAQRLKVFVSQVQAAAGTQDVILLGDFNAYAKEDPIEILTQGGAIVDLVGRIDPEDYSYVFDGFAGRLDHGFGSASIVPKVSGATSWHVNADEPTVIDYNTEFNPAGYYSADPFRSSDHDPMVLGLNLYKSIKGTAGRDTLVGTAGDDIIEGGPGADTLTGGGGRDQFVYTSMGDAGDVITDFNPADDLLDVRALLQSLGLNLADPFAQGHIVCTNVSSNALVGIDAKGTSGFQKSRPLVQLKGLRCEQLSPANYRY
ncbi:ExeM/NucH family extracellular endonuclease [Paucibacter sp. DJ1R-11]|uniref:ExeM/NucH family extracellular endonuclease n=1 Tax=Paucibacter sp. DJ1R-11 TaxID=2893556 RepID=UPI0029623419|nr:ExeM/NucH family extracellular endonuclease [Paucibacter sp. DJ1R-11]